MTSACIPESAAVLRDPFVATLEPLSVHSVFFEPLAGNNGDKLIELAAEYVLARSGVARATAPEAASQILINGGGAINDIWMHGIRVFESYVNRYPDKPITVAPSSFLFERTNFAAICARSNASITLFAREKYSFAHLNGLRLPENVSVCESKDLAFELQGSRFIDELRSCRSERHVLISMRRDVEGGAPTLGRLKGRFLPSGVRRQLAKVRDRMLARAGTKGLFSDPRVREAATGLPVLSCDVSSSVGFEEFVGTIRDAAVIITDRLHVAILGALLGAEVFVKPGRYHKIRGVVERDLSGHNFRATLV